VAFSGANRGFGGGGEFAIYLDGREISRGVMPHFAGAARAFGVTG
jgi:hypothetical protein